jgi:hypothetical protein
MRSHAHPSPQLRRFVLLLSLLAVTFGQVQSVRGGLFRNRSVGGVSIDANGVLKQPTAEETRALRQTIEEQVLNIPDEMDRQLGLRRISLRLLEAALQQAEHADLDQLPDEVKYLAGLQRIQYVLVYPEQQDIVLVGPAEGWRVNELGHAVGKTTGRPIIQLEDLLIAMQTAFSSDEPVSCSIDPTEEGTRALRALIKQQKQFEPQVIAAIEQSLGPQQITISGVAETSHFARVLVAADYRMKRIAMRLEPSPLAELPSFLDLLANSRVKLTNMMPRWWLACDYEPLARSEDGLAWELRGNGVQVKTEDSLVGDDGSVTHTDEQNPIAVDWAERMTRQYESLSREEAVFGQLRNLMDLSVIAMLIKHERLLERADCSLATLTGKQHDLVMQSWSPPRTVSTQCSFIKRGRDYLITASGGVQIEAARFATQSQVTRHVAEVHTRTPHRADRWWW